MRVSKAGPVILEVVDNFDKMAGIIPKSSSHKSKCSDEDLEALYKHMRRERPLLKTPARKLTSFAGICSSPFTKLDIKAFCDHVLKTADRLARNQTVEVDGEDINSSLISTYLSTVAATLLWGSMEH